jgi:hypothetical protein
MSARCRSTHPRPPRRSEAEDPGLRPGLNAVLALLHLDLGGAADADHRDAAREPGQTRLCSQPFIRSLCLGARVNLRHRQIEL